MSHIFSFKFKDRILGKKRNYYTFEKPKFLKTAIYKPVKLCRAFVYNYLSRY